MKLPRHKIFIPITNLILSLINFFIKPMRIGKSNYRLEDIIKSFWKKNFCIALPNWRTGFYFSLKSLPPSQKNEVIITGLHIVDSVNAVILAGFKPVFVDLDLNNHCVDFEDLEKKINKNTLAIHMTYLCGMVPNIDKFKDICEKNSIYLIEDISQSYGAKYKNEYLGTFGKFAIGSFTYGKCISAIDGGFLITDSEKEFREIISLSKKSLINFNKKISLKNNVINLIASIATQRLIFNILTFNIFRFMRFVNPKYLETIHEPKFKIKNYDKLSYHANLPIRRKEWTKDVHFIFTNTHAELAISSFETFEKGLKKRQNLAKTFFSHIDPKYYKNFPKGLFDYDNCVFYHLPVYCKNIKGLQKFLFDNLIDAVGYAHPLLNELDDFNEFKEDLKNTRFIKYNTLFIPLLEDFSDSDVIKSAKLLNKYFLNENK